VVAVDPARWTTDALLGALRESGVMAVPFGAGRIRMVTHLDVSADDIERAGKVLASLRS
jgi:threonine aldolase